MDQTKETNVPYATLREVFRWHGLIVPTLSVLLRPAPYVFPLRWCFLLSRVRLWRKYAYDNQTRKTEPWWQDLSVLIVAGVTAAIVWLAHSRASLSCFDAFVAWFLLVDIATYHAGVLWFDDLRPGRTWKDLRVFSHRRILFQGLINFAQSVFLFALLYRYHYGLGADSGDVYQASFEMATTLSRPDLFKMSPIWLSDVQIGFSVFFLVVVISIVASVGYTRGELAPSDGP